MGCAPYMDDGRCTIQRNYEFKPTHVVFNVNYRHRRQETTSIDLLLNYALFAVYKARISQNRITKNILIKYLSHLLKNRLDIEKNRICKRNVNVMELAEICKKVEEMF